MCTSGTLSDECIVQRAVTAKGRIHPEILIRSTNINFVKEFTSMIESEQFHLQMGSGNRIPSTSYNYVS